MIQKIVSLYRLIVSTITKHLRNEKVFGLIVNDFFFNVLQYN